MGVAQFEKDILAALEIELSEYGQSQFGIDMGMIIKPLQFDIYDCPGKAYMRDTRRYAGFIGIMPEDLDIMRTHECCAGCRL